MSGIIGGPGERRPAGIVGADQQSEFVATINSGTLPTITTASVPYGKSWIAHGVCKLVEAEVTSTSAGTSQSAVQSSTYGRAATDSGTSSGADGGTQGSADSGIAGYTHHAKWCAHYCARYCAHYCAQYCAHYCSIAGYGYGFGKAYGFGYGYGYGKSWIAHGVCKLVEAEVTSTSAGTSQSAVQSSTYGRAATDSGVCGAADSGTQGSADSGIAGYTHHAKWCAHYCARYCAHYCARYCAHYCSIAGYGYGFGKAYGFGYGYGYGSARGYASTCTAVAVNGSASWTQIVPAGFTVTTWLYSLQEEL